MYTLNISYMSYRINFCNAQKTSNHSHSDAELFLFAGGVNVSKDQLVFVHYMGSFETFHTRFRDR